MSNLTNEDVIQKLIPLLENQNDIANDIKNYLEEAKDAGLNHAALKAAAKLIVDQKEQDYKDKTKAILDLLNP